MKKFWFPLFVIAICSFFPFLPACGESDNTTSYEIECEYSDGKLVGKEKVSFYNFSDNTINELKFNLFANAFRKGAKYSPVAAQYFSKCYPNGESFGEIIVEEVSVDGEKKEYMISGEDQNVLCVPLLNELFPNERVSVEISFTLSLADVVARTGKNSKTVNLANFYPILCALEDDGFYECVYYANGDPFYSDCADYKVKITCDEKFSVASAGKRTSSSVLGSKRTDEYCLKSARSFCMVLSEKFECITAKCDSINVNYYYYNDENPQKSMETAIKSLKTFSSIYGEYAYDDYTVVQTEFNQGGMEFPTIVMISDDLEFDAYQEVIVHETAHQWWQSAVGNNEIEYGFLDEGLAEYSVVVFYEENPEYNVTRKSLILSAEQTFRVFCSVYDKLFGKVDTSMTRSLPQFSSEYEYVNVAYVKSCIMYEELRNTVGNQVFFKSLKKYYSDYKFKNATPDDLVGCFEKCGADANGFFESFFNGKAII